jgi:hypothetical protein
MTWSLTKMVMNFLLRLPGNSWFLITHPKERKEKIQEIKDMARKEFDHYWMGSKVRTLREERKSGKLAGCRLTCLPTIISYAASHGRCANSSQSVWKDTIGFHIDKERTKTAASNNIRLVPTRTLFDVYSYPVHGVCLAICAPPFP